ncbi:hypothetical protein M8J77_003650 [Diaphorina citri]|nr:hypothetical protein M8J77_003650 [Diaphorina citri]
MGIISEIKKRGISEYLVNILMSYFEHRKLKIEDNVVDLSCGVPQGSVLGGTLWNIYYDPVLRMEVQANSKLIAYADDLVVVTWADTKTDLEREMKETIIQIENWMEDHKLKLALQKTEIVMLASKRRCKEISVEIGGMVVTSKMCAKYLGVYFDRDMRMKEHLKKAVEKAGKTANNLARVMPNIDGPDNGKRRMLASVVYSILLYGAPVWGNVTKWHKYVTLLERVQRKVMLRLCRAYRTTSTPALQIITGTLPIELMVKEKVELYTLNKINDEEEQKIREEELKENLWEIWMEKWENETTRGQWTKRIIKNVKEWVERKHGCVTYEMSQFLTGHGNFGTYLKRMRKVRTERCQYCEYEQDDPCHTFFGCQRFNEARQECYRRIGRELSPDNVIEEILKCRENWEIYVGMIRKIIRIKEADGRLRAQQ